MFKVKVVRRWVLVIGVLTVLLCLAATAIYAQAAIKIIVDGKEIAADVPPQIVDGRTLVPLRTVAEALDAQVDWDADTSSVVITTSTPKLLLVNGEQTTWPYWYEDGNLYLEYHDAIELVRMAHGSFITISYSKANGELAVNDAIIELPAVARGPYTTISVTNLYTNHNLIKFDFDSQTGSLTLLPL